jgi:hypothetical protein
MTAEERAAKIAAYERAYDELTAALREFPQEMWQYRAAPDGWTIHETVVHITDSEANSYARCRRCIAEPGQTVMAYDENVWATALDYQAQSTADALELFKWLRRHSYNFILTLPEATSPHTIDHPDNASMTLDDWLDVYTRHVPEHIAQMRAVHAAWQRRDS